MSKVVLIEYNPFLPMSKILIDRNEIDEYSQLMRFASSPVWYFQNRFCDILYSEIREEFIIEFYGTEFDSRIFELICNRNEHCIGFKKYVLKNLVTTQKRLGDLNQYIKRKSILNYRVQSIDCLFFLDNHSTKYKTQIEKIEIANLFCKVSTTICDLNKSYKNTLMNSFDYVFIIAEMRVVDKFTEYISTDSPIFLLQMDNKFEIRKVKNNYFIFSVTEDIISSVFRIMLDAVLPYAIGKCVDSLDEKYLYDKEIQRITRIDGGLSYEGGSCVEAGKSIPFFVIDNSGKKINHGLIYKPLNKKMITCDGMSIYGHEIGETVLEIYKLGERKPVLKQKILVINRNRIKKIILDNDSIVLGENDTFKMSYDFFPLDADNENEIYWKSTDESVISVNDSGNIIALKSGNCEVICIAGNVSARCKCIVKPYLKRIDLSDAFDKKMEIEAGQEKELNISLYPPDPIDSKLNIASLDYDIVNVVGNKVIGKKSGTTSIIISNGTVELTIKIKVSKKKKSFIKNIFS